MSTHACARWSISLVAAAAGLSCSPPPVIARTMPGRPHAESVGEARALDQQGVLAFEAGRFHDAILYFDAAFEHWGPPSERWNSARCHLRLDEPAQAEAALVEYMGLPGLTSDDRREAETALDAIRHRPSMLTVMSVPLGLAVFVDGRRSGVTPMTVPVAAGDHVVVVERAPDARQERSFTARFARAILVEGRP